MPTLEDLPPSTQALVNAVVDAWPEHRRTLEKSMRDRTPEQLTTTERLAQLVQRLAPDPTPLVEGYKWMCEMKMVEELHFRRHGRYRHGTFDEVADFYADDATMQLYLDGMLASTVLWVQHLASISFYLDRFLARNKADYAHLEVGPGHGILLYFAAIDPRCESLVAWDISPASLAATGACLQKLGVQRPVALEQRDVLAPYADGPRFDSICFSEVLEHLDDPVTALTTLRGALRPGGRMFINVPVNAPAIDHLYLFTTPEQVVELVESAGLRVLDHDFAPSAGYSMAKARKWKSSITVALTAVAE